MPTKNIEEYREEEKQRENSRNIKYAFKGEL